MRRLIAARHAETALNVTGVLNGDPSLEVGLTDEGRAQAQRLGEAAGLVDLVSHSAFGRARETAALAWPGAQTLEVPELNEFRYGSFEGTRWSDGFADWTQASGPFVECPGGGESRVAAVARYVRGFRIVAARPEERIALVAHGAHVACLLLAREGRAPGPVLEQIPFATGFDLTLGELVRAIDVLEAWVASPAFEAH
ncbi:MAG: histidine phosphatase family protein [Actinomycetota bacterium]|nr:histidine phosphatase family protein [Actinomycetota bacterium]